MLKFYQSTIGKKIVVAVTGLILFGFVVGHLLGNLQVFAGPQKINDYAAFLKANPPILWGTRIVLLIAVFLHILTTIQLTRMNRQARPIAYKEKKTIQATLASQIMIYSGLLLAVYIVFHLLHLTVGNVHPDFHAHDVYGNLITGFSVVGVTVFYILAMCALGYHLYHGVWSVFQTLGLNHPKYNVWRRCFAVVFSILIAVGYITIPVAVLMKVIR